MSSTTSNKPAKVATRAMGKGTAELTGARFAAVTPECVPVYPGGGVALAEAVRLAEGMVAPTGVARVEEDGSLTLGTVITEARGFGFTALTA